MCLFFVCVSPLFSQIVNEGIIKIMPSTFVYFGDEYTNKNSGIHNNEGDLNLNSNFINNGLTTAAAGITRFNSAINSIQ